MKKSTGRETPRAEAARMDALERRGKLDALPFTRARRYAKEPSQVYAIRIPVSRLAEVRWLADRRGEQPTALLREWVLERLDEELASLQTARAKEAPARYAAKKSTRTPRAKKTSARKKG